MKRRASLLSGSVLLSAAVAVGAMLTMPSAAVAASPQCQPGWHFTHIKKKRVRMLVDERRRMENATNTTARVDFYSKKSRTVKMSASVGLEASYNAIFVSVKAKIDVAVSREYTSEIGERFGISLKPKYAAQAKHGVFIRPVTGLLTKGRSGWGHGCIYARRITAYLPRSSGWRVSTSPL